LSYLNTIRKASDDERKRLACGRLSLSSLHNAHRRRPVSDADVEAMVKKIGPDRIWRALDRLTSPMRFEAAE
jgi:hypothetical protein